MTQGSFRWTYHFWQLFGNVQLNPGKSSWREYLSDFAVFHFLKILSLHQIDPKPRPFENFFF